MHKIDGINFSFGKILILINCVILVDIYVYTGTHQYMHACKHTNTYNHIHTYIVIVIMIFTLQQKMERYPIFYLCWLLYSRFCFIWVNKDTITVNPSNAEATFIQSTRTQIFLKIIKTLSCWYSLESSWWVLSDEYPFARVSVISQVFCIILYWPN